MQESRPIDHPPPGALDDLGALRILEEMLPAAMVPSGPRGIRQMKNGPPRHKATKPRPLGRIYYLPAEVREWCIAKYPSHMRPFVRLWRREYPALARVQVDEKVVAHGDFTDLSTDEETLVIRLEDIPF